MREVERGARYYFRNSFLNVMVIAMIFIVLSSVSPAIMSSIIYGKIANKVYASGQLQEDNPLQPVDTSDSHATLPLYGTHSSAGPFESIPQASNSHSAQILGSLSVRPTNNIVNTKAFYDIVFTTSSPGAIKRVVISFQGSIGIPSSAFLNEVEGIGPGTVTKSGQTLVYTVNNPTNVPAGTKIRLEFANIINPGMPGEFKVTVSTRDAANGILDGPTQSAPFTIKQIGTHAIATTFAYQRILGDGQNGWNPNGATTLFDIQDPLITSGRQEVLVNLSSEESSPPVCGTSSLLDGTIRITCNSAPENGAQLKYVVFTPLCISYPSCG